MRIINRSLEIILIIVIALIFLTGQNKLILGYKIIISLFALIPFFIMYKKKINIHLKKENIIWILLYIVFLLGLTYTIDLHQTLYYLVIYICGFLFLYHKLDESFWKDLFKTLEILTFICAITILIEKMFPDFFEMAFDWFGKTVEKQYDSRAKGYSSGILFEGARAAFIVNVGIAITFSKFLNMTSKTDIKNKIFVLFEFIVMCLALLFTGKRTLTAIGVILIVLLYLIANKNNKKTYKKLFVTLIVVAISLGILSIFIPDIIKPFKRMMDIGENIGGRSRFWATTIEMFKESPILGKGIGSFNEYLAQDGMTYYGGRWTSHAHNSYLQILGETGIVGIGILSCALLFPLIRTMKILLKNDIEEAKEKTRVLTCLYIQLLFIIYALTGNPFHNFPELYIYMIFISYILNNIEIKKGISEEKNDKNKKIYV